MPTSIWKTRLHRSRTSYPERQEKEKPLWLWVLIGIASLLLIAAIVGFVSYQLRFRRVMKTNKQLNRRLALINETTKVRIWTYDVNDQLFSWRDENGRVAYTYTLEEFSKRYSQDDFIQLKDAIKRLVNQYKDARGHEEEEETLELRAKDMEDGDNEVRNFLVVVSVLRRDKEGKPTVIIGTKKDVTEARRLKPCATGRSSTVRMPPSSSSTDWVCSRTSVPRPANSAVATATS